MLPAAAAVLATGCSHSAATRSAPSGPSAPATAAPPSNGPTGSVHTNANGSVLDVTQVVAHLDASGDGSLSMAVRNSGSVTDHLDFVSVPGGSRGVLKGGKSAGSGAMTSAGIQFPPGTSVTFGSGPGDPTVRLTGAHGVTGAHTLPLILQFGVSGLIRVQAQVPAAGS
jgi:hypothetical protein